ncbi:unnamed protein product, partial [marine sediment metagenome]
PRTDYEMDKIRLNFVRIFEKLQKQIKYYNFHI